MIGAEAQYHFQAQQRGESWSTGTACAMPMAMCERAAYLGGIDNGVDTFDEHPFQIIAGYALADITPIRALRFPRRARYDQYLFGDRNFGAFSPRVAAILRPYADGNIKVLFGRAFRAPGVYEQFYNDGGFSTAQSSGLTPETMWSGEVEFSHRFSTTWTGTIAGYGNLYTDSIFAARIPNPAALTDPEAALTINQYQNRAGTQVLTAGGEVELRREWRQGWMFSASYSFQQSRYLEQASTDGLREVPNAPVHLASIRGAMPIVQRLLTLSTRMSFEGPRWDRNEDNFTFNRMGGAVPSPDVQTRTDAGLVWDLVLSGQEQRAGFRYALGVYNILDWRYDLPVSRFIQPTTVRQNGRTILASLGVNF